MLDRFLKIFSFPKKSQFANIVIVREDLSETGSHKFRYLKPRFEELKKQGVKNVVLSTTGNAGITASFYGKKFGIKVFTLMSEHGDMNRGAEIEKNGGVLIVSPWPIRFAKFLSKKYNMPLLNASQDENAAIAYESLGEDIILGIPDADAIVNFCTSGTSSSGIMRAYQKNGSRLPALHLVQKKEMKKNAPRKKEIFDWLQKSKGRIWIVDHKDIKDISKIISGYGLETSWEGESSFFVAKKLIPSYKKIVVIFSGKKWENSVFVAQRTAKTLQELSSFFGQSLFS